MFNKSIEETLNVTLVKTFNTYIDERLNVVKIFNKRREQLLNVEEIFKKA